VPLAGAGSSASAVPPPNVAVAPAADPDEVVERIATLSEKLKCTTHLLYMDMGGMPQGELFDAIELVGSAVIPQLAGETVST